MPVLDYSSTQQFIAEGVFSHIEVKSNLTSEELKKSLEITKSVKLIEKKIDAIMHTGELPKHIFSCVFAYKGMSKEKTKEILDQYYIGESNIEKKIDAVCVLGEYIIIKREDPNTPTGLIGLETKDNTLSIFFIELYRSMYKNWEGEPNLIKYIENTSFNRF
jgi:hypothetical protein